MEARGFIRRVVGPAGEFVNELVETVDTAVCPQTSPAKTTVGTAAATLLTEDDVKRAVVAWLQARGLHVEASWGRERVFRSWLARGLP